MTGSCRSSMHSHHCPPATDSSRQHISKLATLKQWLRMVAEALRLPQGLSLVKAFFSQLFSMSRPVCSDQNQLAGSSGTMKMGQLIQTSFSKLIVPSRGAVHRSGLVLVDIERQLQRPGIVERTPGLRHVRLQLSISFAKSVSAKSVSAKSDRVNSATAASSSQSSPAAAASRSGLISAVTTKDNTTDKAAAATKVGGTAVDDDENSLVFGFPGAPGGSDGDVGGGRGVTSAGRAQQKASSQPPASVTSRSGISAWWKQSKAIRDQEEGNQP
ncbi:TPA: hypothetical protein ACH3X1_004443 [Trebouxia sp. C0004]